jgi:hypothetical protein
VSEVVRRRRDEDLAGPGEAHDSRGGMDGDAPDLAAVVLDLARMDARPDRDAERLEGGGGRRAPHRTGRAVEGCEEAVARRCGLVPAEAVELSAHDAIVATYAEGVRRCLMGSSGAPPQLCCGLGEGTHETVSLVKLVELLLQTLRRFVDVSLERFGVVRLWKLFG